MLNYMQKISKDYTNIHYSKTYWTQHFDFTATSCFLASCIPRVSNWIRLSNKCAEFGVALVEVPADGNCLAWSLRTLYGGFSHCDDAGTQKATKAVKRIRSMVSSAWEIQREEPMWQMLFNCFCADRLRESGDDPHTPKKNKSSDLKKNDGGCSGELQTPPRPEGSKRRKGVERVEGAQAVPLTERAEPVEPRFKKPGCKQVDALEPDIPDLEEAFHNIMHKLPPDPSQVDIAEIDASMPVDGSRNRKRAVHTRAKRKEKTPEELTEKQLNLALATFGLTYVEHLSLHKQAVYVKKSAVCTGGTWANFKALMRAETMPECPVCVKAVENCGITWERLRSAINDAQQGHAQPGPSKAPQEAKLKRGKKSVATSEAEDLKRTCEFLAWIWWGFSGIYRNIPE